MKKNFAMISRLILTVSVGSMVFYTTPAWLSGFCAAGIVCLLLIFAVWKLSTIPEMVCSALAHPWILAAGLVITGAYGVNFYNMWLDSSYILRIARVIHVNHTTLVLVLAVLFSVLSVPCVACVLQYAVDALTEDFRRRKEDCCGIEGRRLSIFGAFVLLCIVYVLGISAILRANFLYQDDAGRAAFGYKQWDYFGRFLSTAMATVVHGGDYLTDAAPLPQLLAMVIMAISGVLVLYVFYGRAEYSVWEVLSVLPLGLNPYFLECLSFRFDAPYMAVSVLGALVPLLFYGRHTLVYLFMSAIGVIAVCTSYQAATGIFPIAVILLALRMWNRGESMGSAIRFCLKSAVGYGIGLVYFKLILMRPADAGYVSNSMPSLRQLLPNTMNNLRQYYSLIASDFKPVWLAMVILLVVGFLLVTILSSTRAKWKSGVLSCFGLGLSLFLCFGLYPFLETTLFAPRAMYGFGALLAMLGVISTEGKRWIPAKLPVMVLSWLFFVFSFTYGNALNYQREYTDFRIESVLNDMKDMEVFRTGDPVIVQISGAIGQAPILENMPQNYQMLNRLVPETFAGGDDLTQMRFFKYYDLRNAVMDLSVNLSEANMSVVKDTMYHTIHADESNVWIVLK